MAGSRKRIIGDELNPTYIAFCLWGPNLDHLGPRIGTITRHPNVRRWATFGGRL